MPRRTGFNPEPTAPSHLWPCIFAALLLAALGLPAICTAKDRTIDHPPVSAAVDFALTDHNGELFELRRLRGRIVLIFFGYTACPDVCPNELTNLASVLRALGEKQVRVQALFISIDPQRDTPAQLKGYVDYFAPGLIGLTGSPSQIDQVAKLFNASYHRVEREDGRYFMDHSANLYLLDEGGRPVVAVPYGLPREHILEVVKGLLAEGAENR